MEISTKKYFRRYLSLKVKTNNAFFKSKKGKVKQVKDKTVKAVKDGSKKMQDTAKKGAKKAKKTAKKVNPVYEGLAVGALNSAIGMALASQITDDDTASKVIAGATAATLTGTWAYAKYSKDDENEEV